MVCVLEIGCLQTFLFSVTDLSLQSIDPCLLPSHVFTGDSYKGVKVFINKMNSIDAGHIATPLISSVVLATFWAWA